MSNKVSVCITVFNEEKDIAKLLKSLLNQTMKADEIVIVDGGSSDKTVEVIRRIKLRQKQIKLFIKKGTTAEGRNESVRKAKGNIIATTDAGCIAKKDWLEKLIFPLYEPGVGLVAGFYKMPAKGKLQRVMNIYHGVPPERFDKKYFLPSARSCAFRKKVWQAVGGFNEKLNKAGEDTEFFYKVVKHGVKIVRVKSAQVIWTESFNMSFQTSIKKFYQYAKGDAQAGIWWHPSQRAATHNLKIASIFIRYFLGLVLNFSAIIIPEVLWVVIMGILMYLAWTVLKWRDVITDWQTRLLIPIVQISSDIAVMFGFTSGLLSKR